MAEINRSLITSKGVIATQLNRIEMELATTDADFEQARLVLSDTLNLTRDCHTVYLRVNDSTRRLFNQPFFAKIYIDEDDETRERTIRVDYNEPFDNLFSRLVLARVHHDWEQRNRLSGCCRGWYRGRSQAHRRGVGFSYEHFGGADGIRTRDLLVANQAL